MINLNKYDFSNYIGLLVRIEINRRSGHKTHVGRLLSVRGTDVELLRGDGKIIWCKKPNCYHDSIEVLQGGKNE